MSAIQKCMFGKNMLILDSQKGFAACPNKELFVVYYCKQYDDEVNNDGEESYTVWNSEYFEILEDAYKAFLIRKANSPIRPTKMVGFKFPHNSLANILINK